MSSLLPAWPIAERSEPGPLSLVLVTRDGREHGAGLQHQEARAETGAAGAFRSGRRPGAEDPLVFRERLAMDVSSSSGLPCDATRGIRARLPTSGPGRSWAGGGGGGGGGFFFFFLSPGLLWAPVRATRVVDRPDLCPGGFR